MFAAIVLSLPCLRRVGILGLTRTGLEAPAALFLSWALLGIAFTGGGSGEVLTWSRYAAYILLVVVIGTVAREPRNRRILLWGFVFAGSVTAFHGLIEYVRPRSGIGMQGLDIQIATRVASTFENPNFFGEFLVLLFAATLALVLTEKRFWRITAVGLLAGQTMALFFTYTRGSWVGLAIGLLVALMLVEAKLVLPFIVAGVALVPFVPGAMSRITSIFSIEGTTSFRLRLWRVAGAAIKESIPCSGRASATSTMRSRPRSCRTRHCR